MGHAFKTTAALTIKFFTVIDQFNILRQQLT